MKIKQNDRLSRKPFTKPDYIKYWKDTAHKDWLAVSKMMECKTYVHALFFMHLVLEKLLKAHWVKDNAGNHPPKTHDLLKLVDQTQLEITIQERNTLRDMNSFQLEGRYPEYKRNLYNVYKKRATFSIFTSVNLIRKCLLKKLR